MSDCNEEEFKAERPLLLTLYCILGFFAFPLSMVAVLIPSGRAQMIDLYGALALPFMIVFNMLFLIVIAGYWNMRFWAIHAHVAMVIVGVGGALVLNLQVGLLNHIVPFVMLAIGIAYRKRLT